jgi:cytoskeletal protein CcmA (bactofilin family)
MFTKKSDKEPSAFDLARSVPPPPPPHHPGPQPVPTHQQAPPRPQSSAPATASHIGADLTVIGNLVSKGEVHIDGQLQGDLHAVQITVGETARITGGVVADEVIVRGAISGSIRGRRVVLQSSSHVEGDVFHQQLGIEQGAYFEGKSRRVDDPLAGVSISTDGGPTGPGFPLRGDS